VLIGGKVANEDLDVGAYGFRGGGPVVTGSWRSIGRGLEMGEDDGANGGVCEGQIALERRRLRGRGHQGRTYVKYRCQLNPTTS
jgi:hypothetical protein